MAHTAHHFNESNPHGEQHHGHPIIPPITLTTVLGILLFFTVLTVGLAQFEVWIQGYFHIVLPHWVNIAIAMSIATVKAVMVMAIFMQLRYDNRMNTVVMLFTFFAVGLFLFFSGLDLFTRDRVTPWKAQYVVQGGTGFKAAYCPVENQEYAQFQAEMKKEKVIESIAENLGARRDEFAKRLVQAGQSSRDAAREVEASLERIFFYAAHADKYDGRIHSTNAKKQTTLAFNEPYGVMALVCPTEAPLLAMVSLLMPVLAMGNRAVLVPSEEMPLVATGFYQVLDTSDVPGGAVNIVTGARDELAKTLAEHDEVAAMWYHGSTQGAAMVEKASAGNLKATWTFGGRKVNWFDSVQAQGHEYLRRSVQVKNIWIPYGE